MDTLLQYSDALKDDRFSDIPRAEFQDSVWQIYDENGELLYSSADSGNVFAKNDQTDHEVRTLTQDELNLIPDYDADSFYRISQFEDTADGNCYEIDLYNYSYDTDEQGVAQNLGAEYVIAYCTLDENLNRVGGTLFEWKDSFSKDDLQLLTNSYDTDTSIEKGTYTSTEGKTRTAVIFNFGSDYDDYYSAWKLTRVLMFAIVPLAVLFEILFAVLMARRLKKSISPLNEAMLTYGRGERPELDAGALPHELQNVAESFEQMHALLEESRKQTEQSQAEKQRILSNLSHDLKTPLTVIEGYSMALSDGLVAEENRQKYYNVIYERCHTMSELLETLLKYTRISQTSYEMNPEETDICEYCRRYISEKLQEISLAKFKLDIEIPENAITLKIDRKLIRRAFDNLVSNALKYNPAGTKLTFRLSETENKVRIIIADDGIGIPMEIIDKVFDSMVSGNRARTAGSGSGIGLSIVRRVMELHKGSVDLINEPGTSTCFEILLPKTPD